MSDLFFIGDNLFCHNPLQKLQVDSELELGISQLQFHTLLLLFKKVLGKNQLTTLIFTEVILSTNYEPPQEIC